DAAELDGAVQRGVGGHGIGVAERGLDVQDLVDAFGAHRGAGDHHGHERAHHDRHEDLQQVLQEGGERADLHVAVGHAVAAEPEHGGGGQVQDHPDEREHQHEELADADADIGQALIGGVEALGLIGLADERADHADAYDLLAQHAVDGVDALLHQAEQRHEEPDQDADDDDQERHGDPDQPGQPGVLAQGHDDAADAHDRRGHHEVQAHEHEHLDLLDIVGAARDQRGGPELVDLPGGEPGHGMEDATADVAPDGHGGVGPEVDGGDCGEDLDEGNGEHDPAGMPDEIRVAPGDALVDDARVQAGQVQGGHGGGELEDQYRDDPGGIGFRVLQDEA